jgi:5'-nucleotidase
VLILIDQDGPLADFEAGFLRAWRTAYADKPYVPLRKRRSFLVSDDYPLAEREYVEAIYHRPGFYRELPPMPGSADALRTLLKLGHDVVICTTPLAGLTGCVEEKYEWIERHLGVDFTTALVTTTDKTMIRGDVLIDDRPSVDGRLAPSWQHVIFDRPYNRHVQDKLRLTWATLGEILPLVNRPISASRERVLRKDARPLRRVD